MRRCLGDELTSQWAIFTQRSEVLGYCDNSPLGRGLYLFEKNESLIIP
ncbi:hypothetical protein MHM_04970 [Candidatus Mycoplasma haemominutum 'Birmingham 1']|uniref:Uncharacterized protein n=1 Tax=Candidatus Mycoplasma haematominutum 'Birmingham 1' TaxID=1116213 RepID=G8C3W7_9MOLU|nr:hypothetical protein MHM_04970 [Candidatus Mycoplasma haematominutum 'Birmingham 1']